MFEFFRGRLVQASPTKAVIDIGGVGYAVQISPRMYQKLPQINSEVFIYVAPVIREDEHSLYGFLTIEEKNLFHHLTNISGVGPKTAVAILGHIDVNDFQLAIMQANIALLSKIPGVGKKTAERLIIELKDKFRGSSSAETTSAFSSKESSIATDAISALINLGYHPLEAQKKVKKALSDTSDNPSLSDLITKILQS